MGKKLSSVGNADVLSKANCMHRIIWILDPTLRAATREQQRTAARPNWKLRILILFQGWAGLVAGAKQLN